MSKVAQLKKESIASGKKIKVMGVETYVNQLTNEEEEMNVVQIKKKNLNLEKIWLTSIIQTLDIIGNQKLKVIDYLLKIKTDDNLIIATQRTISEKAEVSLPIVNETIKLLIKHGFITRINSGAHKMNNKFVLKDKEQKRLNILFKYDAS